MKEYGSAVWVHEAVVIIKGLNRPSRLQDLTGKLGRVEDPEGGSPSCSDSTVTPGPWREPPRPGPDHTCLQSVKQNNKSPPPASSREQNTKREPTQRENLQTLSVISKQRSDVVDLASK